MSDDILTDDVDVKNSDSDSLAEQSKLIDEKENVDIQRNDTVNQDEVNINQNENDEKNIVVSDAAGSNEAENATVEENNSSNAIEDEEKESKVKEINEPDEDKDTNDVKQEHHDEEVEAEQNEQKDELSEQKEVSESTLELDNQPENEASDMTEKNEEMQEISKEQEDEDEQDDNVKNSDLVQQNESNQQAAEFEQLNEDDTRNETPIRISEKLSRKPSPLLDEMMLNDNSHHRDYEALNTESPRNMEDDMYNIEQVQQDNQQNEIHSAAEEEEDDEEVENEEFFDREALIEQYKNAMKERESLKHKNNLIQTKLAEYFRKKKNDADAALIKSKLDKSVSDQQEQRYIKHVSNLNELKGEMEMVQNEYHTRILKMRKDVDRIEELVDRQRSDLQNLKKDVGVIAINSRTGKAIPTKDLEHLMLQEKKKDDDVVLIRLENIKLQNRLTKQDNALKSKEELGEGLHLIDFEQLKIENQTYNEKIEERNEEILKLRRKITSTVQMLTHLKEKLQFVQHEKQIQKQKLSQADEILSKKRDALTKLKQSRDALRNDNQKLRQNCGLLGNEELLRNFEESVDTVEEKKKRLDRMKMEHAELSLTTNGLRRKIGQTKSHSATGQH